jgi:hypothetical protein
MQKSITPLILPFFFLTFISGCSHQQPTTKLLSKITSAYEVYAPDQTSLDTAVTEVDSAFNRISRILGEPPPIIAFLLFSSNEELLSYDYTTLIKRHIHYLLWLTDSGLKQLTPSNNQGGDGVGVRLSTRVEPIMINYDSLGIFLAKDRTYKSEKIFVARVDKNIRNVQFKKDDIILQVNGRQCKNLSQFDSIYTSLAPGAEMCFELLRQQKKIVLNIQKPASQTEEPIQKSLAEDSVRFAKNFTWNPIAHEAGHIFFIAFVNGKIHDYTRIERIPDKYYGHPLIPDWLDEAMAIFCETDEEQNSRIRQLQNDSLIVVDLVEFLTLNHPNSSGEKNKPNSKKIDSGLFYSQSIAFARYLFEKEGAAFMATMAIDFANGKEFEAILLKAKQIPHDLVQLNIDFLRWLEKY